MRNKKEKESILRADLVKYCKQIGVIDCEVPRLLFNREEYLQEKNEARLKSHYGYGKSKNLRKNRIGECVYSDRLIFVYPERHKNLKQMRHTLVHELVHYRFNIQHGKAFESKIKEILKGREYPRKHIDIPNLGNPWNAYS